MKYRATQPGFIDRIINPSDVVEWNGPPPIAGLVPIEDALTPAPAQPVADQPSVRGSRKSRTPPPAATSDEVDVI